MGCLTDATDASKRSFAALAACHTLSLAMCRLIKRVYSWGPQKRCCKCCKQIMCSQGTHLPEKETSTAKSRVRLPRIKHHTTPFANIYCIVIYPYLSHLSLILHSSYHICLLRTGGGPALALKEILCHSQVVGTSGFHPHYQ